MCADIAAIGRSLPLSRHRLIVTEQEDEAAHTLSCALFPLRITRIAEPRQFRLDMNGRRLRRFFVGFNQFATETEIETEAVEDTVGIALGYDSGHPSYFQINGERVSVSTSTAAVLSHSPPVRIRRPGHSGIFAITMPVSTLTERYEEITGRPVREPMKFRSAVDLTKNPGRLLRELTNSLATELERDGAGPESTLLGSMLEDALICVVLGLTHTLSR